MFRAVEWNGYMSEVIGFFSGTNYVGVGKNENIKITCLPWGWQPIQGPAVVSLFVGKS